jgi:hypothetical protein
MALTYQYKVTGLKVRNETIANTTVENAVVQTYWTLTGTDENGNEGTFSGATPFTADPTDSSGPFIPFDQLTEQDVIAWISDVVETNPGYKDHINAQITKQIDEKISPITEPSLPWANTANTAV